ncbi:MAG: hypothetical protein EBU88_04480, partial [Acidobacteria bacterium]|nr:hypothetical protein [Acidobacteriota bacterium]
EELVHVRFADDKTGWAVGANGTLLRTEDGGRNWDRQNVNVKGYLYHIDIRGKDNAWIVGDKGVILRTSNGGESWERVAVDTTRSLVNISFADRNNGWIVGWNGTILRTGDGGRTWLEQESGTRVNFFGLGVTRRHVWVAGEQGLILKYAR